MADIHSRKETEASKSANKVEAIKSDTKNSIQDAQAKEDGSIKKIMDTAAKKVVGSKPSDEEKVKIKDAKPEKSKSEREFEKKIKGEPKKVNKKSSKSEKDSKSSTKSDKKSSEKKSDSPVKKAEKEAKKADKKVAEAEKKV